MKITLAKSPIGAVPKQKVTVAAPGLAKMQEIIEMSGNGTVGGMIVSIGYLVKAEKI